MTDQQKPLPSWVMTPKEMREEAKKAAKPRPENWLQTKEYEQGDFQIKVILSQLQYRQDHPIPPAEMDELVAHCTGLTSTVKRVYKARRSAEIQAAMESK